jgi:hypothetical protein
MHYIIDSFQLVYAIIRELQIVKYSKMKNGEVIQSKYAELLL